MTDSTDPNRYADPAYREKARTSATLLGEPAATELRVALDTIDKLEADATAMARDDGGTQHIRYAVDAMVTELDEWLENPDPAEAYDELLRVYRELKELA